METREPTKEELAVMHSQLRSRHEKACGPMLIAMHNRMTAAQRVAFFDPCYVAAAMNNFVYRRVFEPDAGVFAGKGLLTHFFCIMEADQRTPCWVVRCTVGDDKIKDKLGKTRFETVGKIRPSMLAVIVEVAESLMQGVGGKTHTRMGKNNVTLYVYRPFTAHERKLAFPVFLNTPGVKIGPINVIELVTAEAPPPKLIVDG